MLASPDALAAFIRDASIEYYGSAYKAKRENFAAAADALDRLAAMEQRAHLVADGGDAEKPYVAAAEYILYGDAASSGEKP
jgi:hypothetical protein